ncbi:MAG: tail fiber domain-containing protein [Lyngbya sp.]|nr:tail fiber domain-containing protein [Lyngbya sp.]
MTQKSRSELKEIFKTGAKPSQQDFADFIESTLNVKDDGIEKPSGANTPLKITAQDTDEKLLDFYAGETKTWSINQKPGENKIGLNISNSGGSKLFIDSSNGNVGLSIDQPTAKLHIQQTGNEDALRIDDELKDTTPFLINKDGNVGIGTSTPSAKLEVSGDLKVIGAITPSAGNTENKGIMFPKDPGGGAGDAAWIRYYSKTSEDTTFEIGTSDNSTDHIALMPSGNVGIGTKNPSAKLEVDGDLKVNGNITGSINAVNINSGILSVERIPNLSADKITLGILSVERIPNLSADKITSGTLSVNRIPNLPANKITSGTISEDLTVSKSLSFGASTRQMINLWNQNYGIGIQGSTQYFRTDNNFAWYKGGTHNDAELNAGTNGTVQMVIRDGNVGIGTTTPSAKLEVSGDLKVTGAITPSAGNSENKGIMFPKDPGGGSDDAAWIRYYSRNPDSTDVVAKEQTTFEIGTSNDITDHIALMPGNGNVGIGTSNPGAKLDVNGGIRIRDTEVDGNWMNIYYEKRNKTIVFYHQNGQGQYMTQEGAWRQNSDISLKQNICDLTGILNQVLQLRPVKFEWKNNRMLNIGFIAQEVEEIFPEIVSSVTIKQEREQEIKGLPYAHFGVLAIAAIKEMKTNYDQELSILQKQIKIMQEQISQTNKNG